MSLLILKEPISKRTWGDRSFSVAAAILWNHLPTKLKSCHSITRFKSLLKTHLMSQFFKDDVYYLVICYCIVHVSRYIILFLLSLWGVCIRFMFLLCFRGRALSTQQGGCVRATNLILLIFIIRLGLQLQHSQSRKVTCTSLP